MNLGRSVAGSSIIHAATGASALGPNHSYSYTPRAPRLKAPFSSSPRTGKGFGSKKRAHFFERLRASENEKGVRLHGLVTGSRHRSLVGFLRTWDRASKGKRKEMIDEFVDTHTNCIGTDLEEYYGNGASLLLSRLSSWLRLSYSSGFAIASQLRAIRIFVAAGSGIGHRVHSSSTPTNFLVDFMQTGGLVAVLEVLAITKSSVTDEDRAVALDLLRIVAKRGRKFKRIICECEALPLIAQCTAMATTEFTLEGIRELVLELGTGNPEHAVGVMKTLRDLLSCENVLAQRVAAQTARLLLEQASFQRICGVERSGGFIDREGSGEASPRVPVTREAAVQEEDDEIVVALSDFVDPATAMFFIDDLKVHYEAERLLLTLVGWEELLRLAFEVMQPMLVNPKAQRAERGGRKYSLLGSSQGLSEQVPTPQMCGIKLASRLFEVCAADHPGVLDLVVKGGVLFGLIGSMANTHDFTAQRGAVEAIRSVCGMYSPAGEALREIVGSSSAESILLCEPSRLGRLLYEITGNRANVASIKKNLAARAWVADAYDAEEETHEIEERESENGGASSASDDESDVDLNERDLDDLEQLDAKVIRKSLSKTALMARSASSRRLSVLQGESSSSADGSIPAVPGSPKAMVSAESFRVKKSAETTISEWPPPPRDVSKKYGAGAEGNLATPSTNSSSADASIAASKSITLYKPFLPIKSAEPEDACNFSQRALYNAREAIENNITSALQFVKTTSGAYADHEKQLDAADLSLVPSTAEFIEELPGRERRVDRSSLAKKSKKSPSPHSPSIKARLTQSARVAARIERGRALRREKEERRRARELAAQEGRSSAFSPQKLNRRHLYRIAMEKTGFRILTSK